MKLSPLKIAGIVVVCAICIYLLYWAIFLITVSSHESKWRTERELCDIFKQKTYTFETSEIEDDILHQAALENAKKKYTDDYRCQEYALNTLQSVVNYKPKAIETYIPALHIVHASTSASIWNKENKDRIAAWDKLKSIAEKLVKESKTAKDILAAWQKTAEYKKASSNQKSNSVKSSGKKP